MKLLFTLLALVSSALSVLAAPAGQKTLINKSREGLALQGYDPVAYFTDHHAVKGEPRFTATHEGATYRFASAEHRDLFAAAPEKYAPAYGGYCGYAASINRLSPISPEFFQVLEGRLILQHNKKAFDKCNAELAANLVKADQNWPGLVQRNGTVGKTLLNLDRDGVAIEGYDPVSYVAAGKPARGEARIQATYNGALYRFVSEQNRETFERDPARYVPAFGGYCGYAASIGKVRPINPELWSIVDGQLILQHSKGAVELWQQDVAGNKAKADRLWPRLVTAKAGARDPIDSLLGKSVLATLD